MQFMKAEASVNVLQFYLTVEEFNSKILDPDLSPKQLKALHQEVTTLYHSYIHPQAVDRIVFDHSIVELLKHICESPPEDVVKLQTSTPLFRAYEHTYDLLENTFLPLFHQSDDYYQMLCGERLPTVPTRSISKVKWPTGDALTLSKIGTKIKGVFKTTTVDGRLPSDIDYDAVDTSPNGRCVLPFCLQEDGGPLHDLSAWRVTIPHVVPKPELDNPRKAIHIFLLEVRRVDVMENDFEAQNWVVERRYHEFYVLEQKLTEFHGDFIDTHLPPKKVIGTKNSEFLEKMMFPFEQYLQKLLTIPTLRGSELLYSFLTSQVEFTHSFLPDINIGKMMKSGAMKLIKEKGQYLDPFLQSYLVSTEVTKPKPSKVLEDDSISISSEKMVNSLFENNANVDLSSTPATPPVVRPGPTQTYEVEGIFDTVVYLVESVYDSCGWFHSVLMTLRMLLRHTLDNYIDWFIGYKLEQVLQEHRAVPIIHLLRDAIFFDNDPPSTEEEKSARRQLTLQQLKDYIPNLFVKAVGKEHFEMGTELVFEVLQQPKLNKQLSYMLLDQLLQQVFPELAPHNPLRNSLDQQLLAMLE